MSRTTLCWVTAAVLCVLSLGMMTVRYAVLGEEVRRPAGPGLWKVTLAVQGTSQGTARVWTTTPLDLDRQHVVEDTYTSGELSHRPPEARHPERRRVVWTQRLGTPKEFHTRSEFLVALNPGRTAARGGLYAAPAGGEYLTGETLIETSDEAISEAARDLTAHLAGSTSRLDAAQALFHHVEQKVRNDARFDGPPVSARTCLERGSGDRCAKSRLLVALLRNRNIPARVVSGVALNKGPEQPAHYWVEAYVYDHWIPMCPFHHHFGRVPSTYLVLGFGDKAVVTTRRVSDLQYAFLIERVGKDVPAAGEESTVRRAFKSLSLYQLPAGDRRLVEVLLLLPVAALVVCVFRNVIGLHSFGTFTPALIGLAFHDWQSWPGLFVFVAILMVGWVLRRWLDRYHLLQVPRIAVMLTLIMSVLVGLIVLSNHYGATTTRYVSLFPIVILTGMVERFWTVETEDGTFASFRTLGLTLVMALTIAVILGRPFVVRHLFCYPETLGLVMASQLLIGRYTGYRVTELFRFRDFLGDPPSPGYTTQAA